MCAASASSRASPLYRIRISASDDSPSSLKMRRALEILRKRAPDLQVDGEMQADAALSQAIRDHMLPVIDA